MLRLFAPGSAPWLLAHEVRLGWRGMGWGNRRGAAKLPSSGNRPALIALGIFGTVVIGLAGVGLGFLAAQFPLPVTPVSALIVDAAVLLLFTLMMSQTITLSVQALYERQDLDLLFSSPLKPRVVLTVRATGIAVVAAVLYLALATPFIITASVLGRPEWLGLYVVLTALGLIASAVGLVLTMGLFALIGARRTRTVAQIMAGVIGGVAFLASQVYNLTRGDDDAGRPDALIRMSDRLTGGGAFDAQTPLAWPVQALTGAALPLLAVALTGVAAFVVVILVLGPRFAATTARAAGGEGRKTPARIVDRPFAEGLTGVMVRKELRLLGRDPQLISQVVLRLVYLVPLAFVLFRNAGSGAGVAVASGAVVILAGQLAGSFSWITLSAEDAPDLLACAPIDQSAADRAKLIAALVPALGLTALALAGLAVLAPVAAAIVLFGCAGAAMSSGLINVWQQRPASRKAFNQRRRGSILAGLVEFLVQAIWAGATALIVAGQYWGLALVAVAALITLAMRRSPERRHRIA